MNLNQLKLKGCLIVARKLARFDDIAHRRLIQAIAIANDSRRRHERFLFHGILSSEIKSHKKDKPLVQA
jgi:hypothetical protein